MIAKLTDEVARVFEVCLVVILVSILKVRYGDR
jgi:hypothetical protein